MASPTMRRRRLARRLLTLRETAGLTAEEAATRAKELRPDRPWSAAKLVRLEGRQAKRLHTGDILTLLDVYGVDDKIEREGYVRLAAEASQTGWWVSYKDILGGGAYVDMESEATAVRTYQGLYVPGLLQTEEYARSVIRGGGVVDDRNAERRVEARMMRQHILSGPDSPRVWAIIDEAALRKVPRDVLEGQLRHLVDVQRPDLRVQILPDSGGPHAAMSGQFVLLDFAEDPTVLYLEQAVSGLFPEDAETLTHYETAYGHISAQALSVDESLEFLEARLGEI